MASNKHSVSKKVAQKHTSKGPKNETDWQTRLMGVNPGGGFYFKFQHLFEEPQYAAPQSTAYAHGQRSDPERLSKLYHQFETILRELTSAAACSDEIAAAYLLRIASMATARIDGLQEQDPALWKQLARRTVQWPILLTEQGSSLFQDQVKKLKNLELGNQAFLSIGPNSRISLENPTQRYAISIINTLELNRQQGWFSDATPGWVREAMELGPLSKKNCKAWAKIGREAFREVFPEPEKIPAFSKKHKYSQEAPSKIRATILDRISNAIEQLAPEEPIYKLTIKQVKKQSGSRSSPKVHKKSQIQPPKGRILVEKHETGFLHFKIYNELGEKIADTPESELADYRSQVKAIKELISLIEKTGASPRHEREIVDVVKRLCGQIGNPDDE